MMELLSLFREEAGWEVTFACAAAESEHAANLEAMGIERRSIEVNSAPFDVFIRELQPDVVLFDRFMTEEQFGWRVAEQCPGALRVLDTEDLHGLRAARRRAVKEGRPFSKRDLLGEEMSLREVASILRSDLALIISEAEMELLTGLFGVKSSQLHYLPYLLERLDEEQIGKWPSFEEREHFVTIGNFRHAPNRDAVRYLDETVWPMIRERLPDAELHAWGAYPGREDRALHDPDRGLYVRGRAGNAKEVVSRARVLLAPLRFGAGLKGKLVEAMECGTPSVTTEIGAEGIAGEEREWCGAIETEPEAFAEAAVSLYADRKAWMAAQENGVAIINGRFSKEEFGPRLLERIESLRTNLEDHRLEHFTGRMLMHHTAAATKYLSKWIEEKNRG